MRSLSAPRAQVNRDLDIVLKSRFGRPFYLGGLAGFPFVGAPGLRAFVEHAPLVNGEVHLLLVFGERFLGLDLKLRNT